MNGSLRVLRAEAARLAGSPGAWFAAALVAVVPVLRVGAAVAAERADAVRRAAEGLGPPLGLETGTGWAFLVDAWRAGLVLVTVLLCVQAARSVAGDRERGLFRFAVTRCASRGGAVAGRALLGPPMVLGAVLLAGTGALAAASFAGDFGPLVEDGYEISAAAEVRVELLRSLLVATLGLVAVHAYALFVSSLAPGAMVGLALALASLLLWDVFKDLAGDDRWWVFASHAPTFVDTSAMAEMSKIARGYSDAVTPVPVFRAGLVFGPLEALLFALLAAWVLRRRPL